MTIESAISPGIHVIAEDKQGTPSRGGAAVQLNGSDEYARDGGAGDLDCMEGMEHPEPAEPEDVPPVPQVHPEVRQPAQCETLEHPRQLK